MNNWLRQHIRPLGWSVLVLIGIGGGAIVMQGMSPDEMPPGQRAYWQWVSSINRGESDMALEAGLELLAQNPQVRPLYLRVARLCLQVEAVAACRVALKEVQPPTSLTRLYREAALALLKQDEAVTPWQQMARAPELDPTLARLIVDQTYGAVETVEAVWNHQLDIDSTAIGAIFGLGYAAVRRFDWTAGEDMLARAVVLAPDEPQIYRELGRIYYFTQQPDKLERAVKAGIEAAQVQYDLEQELIMRGNLGWTMFQRSGDVKEAERLLTKSLEQSRTLSLGRTEGRNLFRLAHVLLEQNRYDEVIPLLRSADILYARHTPRGHADVVVLHGVLLSKMYRFSEAERVLERASVELEENSAVGNSSVAVQVQTLWALSELRLRMGRYAAAREVGEEALALAERFQLRGQEITVRFTLGDAERVWGNHEEARAHFIRAAELARETKSEVHLRRAFSSLGIVALDVRDANTARVYFEQMLRSLEGAGNARQLALAYLGLGHTYIQFQNLPEGLRYYNLAAEQLKQLTEEDLFLRTSILVNKAGTLLKMEAYAQAEALFNEAQRINPGRLAAAYEVEVGLGDAAFSQGQCEEALQHIQKAGAIELREPNPWSHWYALLVKALSHWCLGDLPQAERAFTAAVDVVEVFRADLYSTDRAYFVQDKVRLYDYFAAFLEEQGRSQEAFHYLERSRSRSLVDLLYTSQHEQRTDMDQATDQAVELDRRMRALVHEISAESLAENASDSSANRMAYLRREYQRADSTFRQVLLELAEERPIYTFNPVPEDVARATLEEGEAMVVYNLRRIGLPGREEETLEAYVVLPDQILMQKLAIDSDQLAETIRVFREQLGSTEGGPGEGWESGAQQLYQDLIAPVIDLLPPSIEHLHIVPEGVLYYLPFATLQDADGRFLIERYTLSVTPSASILKLSRDRNPRRWNSMLLLGDPDGSLPGSRREVLAIASHGSSERRYTLMGEVATQENVFKNAGQFDILHFATHGGFVPQAPWRSYLQLHGDDVLSVEEIGQLKLNAYLVTLSACETGLSSGLLSEVPNAEEWVGLNQAFLAAGTPTVMASLWPIDDLVSSDFMIAFYQALEAQGKGKALAQVQRQFINNPRTQHPFYWAPFTIMGDPL